MAPRHEICFRTVGGHTMCIPISSGPTVPLPGDPSVGLLHNRALYYVHSQDRVYVGEGPTFQAYVETLALLSEFFVSQAHKSVRWVSRARTGVDELLRAAEAFVADDAGKVLVRPPIDFSPSIVDLLSDELLSADFKQHLHRVLSLSELSSEIDPEFIRRVADDLASDSWTGLDRQSVEVFIDVVNHSLAFWSLTAVSDGNAQKDNGTIIADGVGGIFGSLICEGGGAAFFGATCSLMQANPPAPPGG